MIGLPFIFCIHYRIYFLSQLATKQYKRITNIVIIRLRQLFFIEDEKNIPIRIGVSSPSCPRTIKPCLAPQWNYF